MDAEKGNVLETETSRLYALQRAIEEDLLITPSRGFSLIDALQFGLYHADTGKFRDPFRPAAPPSTLKQAIDTASIDPTSTVIKVPGAGKIVSLLEAINAGIVDPIAGKLIEDPSGKRLDFANALEQGYILTAEARVSGTLSSSCFLFCLCLCLSTFFTFLHKLFTRSCLERRFIPLLFYH